MAETVGELRVEVSVDPRVHAVEAVRDLADVMPEIIKHGIKVEIDFSSTKYVGAVSTRDSICIVFSKDEV